MQVRKRNGTLQELDISQVRKQTIPACEGLNNVSYEELELNAKIMFFDGINSEDIQKALIKSARNLVSIEQSDYTYTAARLALYDLYHNIKRVYNIDKENKSGNVYEKVTLKDYINFNKEVFSGWYTKYTEEEIDELNKVINSKADLLYNYPGFIALEGRYLIKRDIGGKKEITELPQHMHMAIAMFCMQNEDKSKRIQLIKDYYIALSNLEFINATPINSNGRLKNGGLVSCLLGVAGDSAEGIMDMATEVAIGSKGGSGWGVDFSHIRSLGSSIGGQKNRSGGKVPFAKIYNDVLLAYNQGGKRPGAATLYISCWDIDVFDFIDLRKSSGDERRRARDLFPAIVVDDVFMSRVDNDEEYTLFDPYDTPELLETFGEEFANHYLRYEKEFKENPDKFNVNTNTIEARKLFRYIVTSYNQDGVPFLFFKDNANKAHEHKELGLIKQSNLCIVGDHKIMTEKSLDPMNPEVKTIAELSHLSNGHKAFNTYSMAYDASKKSWSLQVKEAVAFKTGLQRPYARVVLMDGSVVKCTDEHKFVLEDGTKCMAKDLFGKTVMTLNGGVKVAEVVPEVDGVFEDVYDLSVKDNHNFIIDTGKSKVLVSNCVTPDTLVLTKLYGHKPIGELVESGITETECWNGEEWSMTKLFKTSDNDKVVKVKLNNEAVLECTLDHDWWLEGRNGKLVKVKTKDLKPGDKLIRSKYPIINNQGSKRLLYAYSNGVFSAEGVETKNKNRNNTLVKFIYLYDKKMRLRSFLTGKRSESVMKVVNDNNNKVIRVYFNSDDLKEKYFVPDSSYDIRDRLDWLAGVLDGDATVLTSLNGTKIIQLASVNLTFLKNIMLMLQGMGVNNTIRLAKDEGVRVFPTNNGKMEFKEYKTKKMYRLQIPWSGVKLLLLIGLKCHRLDINVNPEVFLATEMRPTRKIKVVSIVDEGKFSPTYCGNEPKRHMLTFNGILTGQCMEIIQPTDYNKTAVCNLGSFNLAKLRFNTERMKEVAKLATRAMDNYIDLTEYPSEKSKRTQLERRSIGGGFLGEAELMATSKIMYGSQEHRDAIDLIYGTISSAVREATRELAKEKGSCIVEGVRNAYLMAIAPNSSSGILASTTNCHEPVYSRIWVEGSKLDEIVMTAPNITPENEKYYVTAFEVPMDTQIELVAQRQKYIDMSISCNLYFNPQNLSIRNIAEVIIKAWKLGCKTTYYLKSKAMSNDDINTDNKNVPLKKENNGIRCVGCEN